MKYLYIILPLALLYALPARAQGYKGEITTEQVQARKVRDKVAIEFILNLEKLKLHPQLMVALTPVIRSSDNARAHVFDPIVISGAKRDRALDRALASGDFHFDVEPLARMRHRNNRPENIIVQLDVPYAPWIREARLLMHAVVTGCGACEIDQREIEVTATVLPPVYAPEYRLSLLYPTVEPVSKKRVEQLHFTIGNADIRPDFSDNAAALERVDQFFARIQADPNLSVDTCNLTGFASPDGNFNSNMRLSEERVYSFVNYLKSKYNLPPDRFNARWVGEDWEGLLTLIDTLSFRGKEEVARLIRTEINIARRKERLKALAGGATYRYLLKNVFPALRRSEYAINYVARPFDVVKAKTMLHQKPCPLTLNEMYMVALTCEKGSDEFNEVFRIALETYPDAPVARINAAATSISRGQTDAAISYLLFVEQPEAWNNLGVAYSNVKNYDLALEYFERARDAGCTDAAHNLQELQKLLDDYLY